MKTWWGEVFSGKIGGAKCAYSYIPSPDLAVKLTYFCSLKVLNYTLFLSLFFLMPRFSIEWYIVAQTVKISYLTTVNIDLFQITNLMHNSFIL